MVDNKKKILFVYGAVRQKDIDASLVSLHIDVVYFYDVSTIYTSKLNKSVKWHCGRHTLIKKNVVNHDI